MQYPHGSLDYKTPNAVHAMPAQQNATLKKRWYPKDTSKYETKEKQQQNKQTNLPKGETEIHC